jgi:hypothetical protein
MGHLFCFKELEVDDETPESLWCCRFLLRSNATQFSVSVLPLSASKKEVHKAMISIIVTVRDVFDA